MTIRFQNKHSYAVQTSRLFKEISHLKIVETVMEDHSFRNYHLFQRADRFIACPLIHSHSWRNANRKVQFGDKINLTVL